MANSRNSKLSSCLKDIQFTANLECQYELLDYLFTNRCLTMKEVERLKKLRCDKDTTIEECNRKLVEYINESNFDKFLDGLRKSDQYHLVNYIERNGIKDQPDYDEWPLNKSDRVALRLSYDAIVQQMDSKSIVDKLISKQCITSEQVSIIAIQATKEERNRRLMQIMKRKSLRQFRIFIECLKEDHYHLWEKLNNDLFRLSRTTNDSPKTEESLASDSASNGSLLSTRCTFEFIHYCFNRITGVAVVDDEIFVVGSGQSIVSVYNSSELTPSRDINIPAMQSPEYLVGCAYNRVLYIGDDALKCIHRVDLTNNSVTGWNLTMNHLPHGLSVTAENTLLVVVWISNKNGESCVIEYTSNGQFVRKIGFEESIRYAYHTLQLSRDRFMVSHADHIHSSSLNRVCLVNSEGKITKSYGREKGEDEGQLSGPYSLAICDNRKYVCVADCWNNRVQMLDGDLTYLGEVHTPYSLRCPARLCFDPSRNRLFVGENNSGRVVVISP